MVEIAAAIAVNRFGLGARAGELVAADRNPRAWLTSQLLAGPPPAALRVLPPSNLWLSRVAAARRDGDSASARALQATGRELLRAEAAARTLALCATEQPFRERLVTFWSNHFSVSARGATVGSVGAFEREAIRPHVTGSFRKLLGAATGHPAMLAFLDNARSVGPRSSVGRRRGKGLNENLGRELLELHTLGVDSGYEQSDVVALAAILTGWGIGQDGRFAFNARSHEPGSKRLLGELYDEDGRAEGELALDRLAMHPATASNVASRLVRHLVADPPPAALVERLRSAFLDSGGDLALLYRLVIEAPEAWERPLARAKSPLDLVISSWRALGVAELSLDGRGAADRGLAVLRQLGQSPFTAPSPAGWPDADAEWLTPAGLTSRAGYAIRLGRWIGDRRDARRTLGDALGPIAAATTRRAIERAPSGAAAIALLVAAPEFQRR